METICATVAFGEFFIGVLANVFMGLANSMDWANTRRVSTSHFIITGMAISRTIVLWTIISITMLIGFYLNEYIGNKLRILNLLWLLSSITSAWFDACLSVFLFLKIANFSHPVFLWLKWRVDKVVFRVLIACMIIFLLICLPVVEKMYVIYSDQRNKANITENVQAHRIYCIFSILFFYIGSFPPFSLCLISCFLLVLSLWRHTRQVQFRVTNSRDPNTEAHVKAMKFIIYFLFLFLLYHVAISIEMLSFYVFRNHLGVMFAATIMNIYPIAHTIILILGNSKLRQASLRVLQKLKHCLRSSGKLLRA